MRPLIVNIHRTLNEGWMMVMTEPNLPGSTGSWRIRTISSIWTFL